MRLFMLANKMASMVLVVGWERMINCLNCMHVKMKNFVWASGKQEHTTVFVAKLAQT